ncbi:hypothetical protein DFH09DRAFT_1070171 [Mycena vulgaris]|nr:hypothetical protein DFH09DRAFT_1070171 [Mycena vulgaris]
MDVYPDSNIVDNPSEEAAAAKLWVVYISEAEKYDKALVESWKSDAGLTAFLIESYETLNSDSGDTTVRLLSQILQQLATLANGNVFPMEPPTPFTPTAASLVCNALWFISLGFSLTCALIATRLEQWARDFLHKIEIRSAPRFNMHTVVEIIPLLLHASLPFFFGGLVAFLIPVNLTVTFIAGVILCIVAAIYSVRTFLPLRHTDSPHRTPLSGAFWRLLQSFQRLWKRRHAIGGTPAIEAHALSGDNMVEAMFRTAIASSDERSARDRRAFIWAMKSLADDNELEPFVEAIFAIFSRAGNVQLFLIRQGNYIWRIYCITQSRLAAQRRYIGPLQHDTSNGGNPALASVMSSVSTLTTGLSRVARPLSCTEPSLSHISNCHRSYKFRILNAILQLADDNEAIIGRVLSSSLPHRIFPEATAMFIPQEFRFMPPADSVQGEKISPQEATRSHQEGQEGGAGAVPE